MLTTTSCKQQAKEDPVLFTNLTTEITGIDFENTVRNSPKFNIFSYRNFYNGGGVAIGDVNNDGLQDIFFTSNMGENKLYINEGNWKFKDVTETAGIADVNKWSTGVSMIDLNNDGYLDIYVCNAGYREGSDARNSLYMNNGDGTFTESAAKFGLDDNGYTTHAVFFDYDLDGDLDVYILNNSFIPVNTLNYSNKRELRAADWPVKDFLKGGGDKLLQNNDGYFTDVSEKAGIYGSLIGFGLGVTVGDVNGDYLPDIYVSNDFFERDYLYINQGNGTFSEELEDRMGHVSLSSMGADMADLNNDGAPEIFVTDMLPNDEFRLKTTSTFDNINVHNLKIKNGFYNQYMQNTLQVNSGKGKFRETAFYSGVSASDWSWGALMFDADQDMLSDIFVCNGIYHEVIDQDFIDFFANDIIQKMVLTGEKEQLDSVLNRMPSKPIQNMAFRNKGDLRFETVSDLWGLREKTFSNGAAYGDLDNDGDLDLIINNVNQPASLYRNNSESMNKHHFIGMTLKAEKPNIDAIGSIVELYIGETILRREHIPNRGFQSSMDMRINFGLGDQNIIDSIRIIWPDKSYSLILKPETDRYHIYNKSEIENLIHKQSDNTIPLFTEQESNFEDHLENEYIDFYYERNIPQMLSKEGPKSAIADLNKDGYDDIYICGAKGQAGQLYFGSAKGFIKRNVAVFEKFKDWEDTEALFFDANGDGHMDLFVGSGGNQAPPTASEMQDRLYINNGKNDFEIDYQALPANGMNTSKALAIDFDQDGDLDLFVASRSYPGEYGVNPRNFLYENIGNGKYREILISGKSELAYAGMITDAVWVDIEGAKSQELLVVGEWMTPRLFRYNGVTFVEVNTSLKEYHGFWQSVYPVDIDNDGDLDLILGNSGCNGYLHDQSKLPLKLFVNDFDGNGMPEKILSRTVEGRDMPVMMKREMVDQLNILKKKNLKYKDYAEKDIFQLLGKSVENAEIKTVTHLKSYVAVNEGNGQFTMKELPMDVQLSNVRSIASNDINNDGYSDLILVGNENGFQPQFGQADCNNGIVLINDKKGNFTAVNNHNSGIFIKGVSRQINMLKKKDEQIYVVLRNNDKPYLFKNK
ncbi:MAG: VCBS repeat-containing protein [Saprospiraceae bacterium]|nr:VCBS repeat-containing protein [Saprospiraceae bacterium]